MFQVCCIFSVLRVCLFNFLILFHVSSHCFVGAVAGGMGEGFFEGSSLDVGQFGSHVYADQVALG